MRNIYSYKTDDQAYNCRTGNQAYQHDLAQLLTTSMNKEDTIELCITNGWTKTLGTLLKDNTCN